MNEATHDPFATTQAMFVGVDEACRMMLISRGLLYRQIREGRLPRVKIGRRTLFRVGDLQKFASAYATSVGRA